MADTRNRMRYFLLSFGASFFLIALLFLFLMTTVHPETGSQTAPDARPTQGEPYAPAEAEALTVLFFGSQGRDDVAGSYLLARFDPVAGAVTVAAFPPQTLLVKNGREETLAEAYRYGGARYTRDALEDYLEIPIDRYVKLHLDSFVRAAAAVGTVEFELEEEFVFTEGGVEVTLHAGRQLLDGRKAAALLTYQGDGELARCALLSRLACALVDQRIDIANSVVVDKVFETVVNLVDTDISYADFEQRKEAAAHLAGLGGKIAVAVPAEGAFSADGKAFLVADTGLAALKSRFL